VARHFQASITTAHVLRASTQDWPKFGADPAYKKLWCETKQNLDNIDSQLHRAGFEADRVLFEGDPVEGILKAVKHHKADLLVLGTHGSRNLERLVLGSTAEEILRKAACPVLTVGPNVEDPSRSGMISRRIVLATDLSSEAAAAAVYAFALSSDQPAHISICHVLPDGHTKTLESTQLQTDFLQKMTELIPKDVWQKSSVEYVVEYGNAADEILKLAQEKHADLIVLGARAASMVATHLVPGVVFRVIAGATCPVLTVCK
jgi:nucleotide-binding universal stress UspA family protein